jgi:hypothetical protein
MEGAGGDASQEQKSREARAAKFLCIGQGF